MFSGSRNSMVLSNKIDVETGSEKFKMAAAKTGCTCILASIQDSKEISTANPMFSGSEYLMALSGRLHQIFKMAAPNWKYLYLSFYTR
jgi:hypothetical protein